MATPAGANRVDENDRGTKVMGEVVVELKLENTIDRGMYKRGLLKEEQVREITVKAIVDTGAVMLGLPQDQVDALGL